MGQTLSEPIVEKDSSSGQDHRLLYGSSAMQGWRVGMEDAHTTLLSLPSSPRMSFFAVFDGHGGMLDAERRVCHASTVVSDDVVVVHVGESAAKYCGQRLHGRLTNEESYKKGDYAQAIRSAYLGTDVDIKSGKCNLLFALGALC
jgi:protein phosphatase 2C family protein 2/3